MPSYFDTTAPIFKPLTLDELSMVPDKYRAMEDLINQETNKDRLTIKEAIDSLPAGDPYRTKLEDQVKLIDNSLNQLKTNGFSWKFMDTMDDIRRKYQDDSGPIMKAYARLKMDKDFVDKLKITDPSAIIVSQQGGIDDYMDGKQYTPLAIPGSVMESMARATFNEFKKSYMYDNSVNVNSLMDGLLVAISETKGMSEKDFENFLSNQDPSNRISTLYNSVKNNIMQRFGITPEKYSSMAPAERNKILSTIRMAMSSAIGGDSTNIMPNPMLKGSGGSGKGTGKEVDVSPPVIDGIEVVTKNLFSEDLADSYELLNYYNENISKSTKIRKNKKTNKIEPVLDLGPYLESKGLKGYGDGKEIKGTELRDIDDEKNHRELNQIREKLQKLSSSDFGKAIHLGYEVIGTTTRRYMKINFNEELFKKEIGKYVIKSKQFNFNITKPSALLTYLSGQLAPTSSNGGGTFSSIYLYDEKKKRMGKSISQLEDGDSNEKKLYADLAEHLMGNETQVSYTPLIQGGALKLSYKGKDYIVDTNRLSNTIMLTIKKVYEAQMNPEKAKSYIEEYDKLADKLGLDKNASEYYKINTMMKRDMATIFFEGDNFKQVKTDKSSSSLSANQINE